jgi:cytidyltransferase-like protein
MMKHIILVSGGFDPLHSGHLEYLRGSKVHTTIDSYPVELVVGINSDEWLIRKKGAYFLPQSERILILDAIKWVNWVLTFDDSDDSACDFIHKAIKIFGTGNLYTFANGGDRHTNKNIPEQNQQYEAPVIFTDGVGGYRKQNSSSDILKRWIEENVEINTK